MQDVGEQKLLMLLLVVQSDFEDPAYVGKLGAARLCEQMLDRLIDMPAIGRDFLAAGPGQQPRRGRAWRGPAAT